MSIDALTERDFCLVAVLSAASKDQRSIGTDEDVSDCVRHLLEKAGRSDRGWSWHLGQQGRWFLEEVASYTDRLGSLDWATADSPYVFTPHGFRRCVELLFASIEDAQRGAAIRELMELAGLDTGRLKRQSA